MNDENLKNLMQCQKMLHEASYFNNEFMKKYAIEWTRKSFPDVEDEVKKEWLKNYSIKDLTGYNNAYELCTEDLNSNVILFSRTINSHINQYNNWSISSTSIQRIFFQPQPLSQDYVLYTEDEKELKVSDFMSVLCYGKKFAEAFFGIDSPKTSEYMLAVKTVDLAINHKETDKPLNKTLHIINDVLTESVKSHQEDKGAKMVVSGISLLVDLTIDFLVKG